MELNKLRDTQHQPDQMPNKADAVDWRSKYSAESRREVIDKILESLKNQFPYQGQLTKLNKIAARFEEQKFEAAASKEDYLRKISLKLWKMDNKNQNNTASSLATNPASGSQNPVEPAPLNVQVQRNNQGQAVLMPSANNKPEVLQQMVAPNLPENIASNGIWSSAGLASTLSHFSHMNQSPLRDMHNMTDASENGVENSMGRGVSSSVFNNQKGVPGRHQVTPGHQQFQQQGQFTKQNQLQQGTVPNSLTQSFIRQQQQPHLLQPNQTQSSQQPGNSTSNAVLKQHPHSALRQQQHPQQTPVLNQHRKTDQTMRYSQPQQQLQTSQPLQSLMRLQMNITNLEPAPLKNQITSLKETYVNEIRHLYLKVTQKVDQLVSLPQQSKEEQLEKFNALRYKLKGILTYLQVDKSDVTPALGEKLANFEKLIVYVLNVHRPRIMENVLQPMQTIQQAQTKETRQNISLQANNIQGPIVMDQNSTCLQQNSVSSQSEFSSVPVDMSGKLKPDPNEDSGQGSKLPSLQQRIDESLQKNSLNAPQQTNIKALSAQNAGNLIISSISNLQSMSSVNQQHVKDQQVMQNERLKPQIQNRCQQMTQKQQQLHQQSKYQQQAGTPLKSSNSPFVVPSPSTLLAASHMQGVSEKNASNGSPLTTAGKIRVQHLSVPQVHAIETSKISAFPLLADISNQEGGHVNISASVTKSSITEEPIERLVKAVKSISNEALTASVIKISSVANMVDRIAGSGPGIGSRAVIGEDLIAMTKCQVQAKNLKSKKMKRCTSSLPVVVVETNGSRHDNFTQVFGSELSDLELNSTSRVKRPRTEVGHSLLKEISDINQRIIEILVNISEEDLNPCRAAGVASDGSQGIIVKCSYNAVALSPNLSSQLASSQLSPIQPLLLLVPSDYPNCSPVFLDELPVNISNENGDLSMKAKSMLSRSLCTLSQPMSLEDIARTWDVCTRAVISEYAQARGGGSFSSNYGSWESVF